MLYITVQVLFPYIYLNLTHAPWLGLYLHVRMITEESINNDITSGASCAVLAPLAVVLLSLKTIRRGEEVYVDCDLPQY